MLDITILVDGYAREQDGVWTASSNTVLVKGKSGYVLVDPGSNPTTLRAGLKREGLEPKDIHRIFLTHYHLDHILNLRLFQDADIYDGTSLWHDDTISPRKAHDLGPDIVVLPTPGHAPEHASLLVRTENGIVGIAGDVFWWQDGQAPTLDRHGLLGVKDEFANDSMTLQHSRETLLDSADFIIPGHGKMFPSVRR